MFKRIIILCAVCTLTVPAFAEKNVFTDKDFGQAEFELVSKDLAAAFAHTTNSGGSSLGSLWGVEVGIVVGALKSDNLQDAAQSITGDKEEDLAYLPYAGIVAGIALPFSIGAELSLVPKIDLDDGSFSNSSIGLRWSVTDFIPIVGTFSPLKIAARASYGTTKMDYSFSTTANSTETADFEIKTKEFGLIAGLNFFLVEPYLGVSTVKSNSTLNAATDFTFSGIISNRTLESDPSGTRAVLGVLLKLSFSRFGLEASTLHSSTRYTFKMSLKI